MPFVQGVRMKPGSETHRGIERSVPRSSFVRALMLTAMVFILKTSNLQAAAVELKPVGSWPGYVRAPASRMATESYYAYVITGVAQLVIFDISDPRQARQIARYEYEGPSWLEGIAVLGGYLYLATGTVGLQVIDARDPASPHSVGGSDTSGYAEDVFLSGNYAYVADGFAGLQVFDIHEPANPKRVGGADTSGTAEAITVAGNYAYVADREAGLQVIDVSDPTSPRPLGSYFTGGSVWSVAAGGNYAYVLVSKNSTSSLEIIDVSNPVNPSPVSSYRSPSPGTTGVLLGLTASGTFAYLASGRDGLQIVDVGNPASPRRIGACDTRGLAGRVVVSGDYAYLTGGDRGLQIIDIRDPTAPQLLSGYATGGQAQQVVLSGHYAYLADGEAGLQSIDITNLAAPKRVSSLDALGSITHVALSGEYAYVVDVHASTGQKENNLLIVDVSDPTNLKRIVGYYTTTNQLVSVGVSGDFAYAVNFLNDLEIIDVSTPSNPRKVGSVPVACCPFEIILSGDYAYVLSAGGNLRPLWRVTIFDITTPAFPKRVGDYFDADWASNVAIADTYAYVAGYHGIQVLDISQAARPRKVGAYGNPAQGDSAYGIAVSANYAYVARSGFGLLVLEVGNPGNPQRVGSFQTKGFATGVAVAGDHVFVAAGEEGLLIFDSFRQLRLEALAGVGEEPFRFRLTGQPGQSVRLQRSVDLKNWQDWKPVTLGSTPIELPDPDASFTGRRFYRAGVE